MSFQHPSRLVGLVGLTAAFVLLVAVGGSAAASSAGSASPLVINMPVGPSTLDPAEECGLSDLTVSDAVYPRLTQYGSKPGPDGTTVVDAGHIVPDLATSWTISTNGLVYTFHLHPGLTFSSGNPVNSAAVKFSLMRSVTMGGCGGYFIYDGIYTPPLIKSIATPSPLTVVITLSTPDANVLQDWAQPAASILDPSVVNAHGGVQKGKINTWMAGHVAAGDGPYLLQSYEPNKQAVFVANPKFFDQPASKEVIVNFIGSDPTLLLDAKNGSADVTLGLSDQSAHSLVGDSAVKVVADPTSIFEQIGLPNNMAPFNNLEFREGLTYAVPYQQILSKVIDGYGTLYYGAYPPAMATYSAMLEPPRTYNLAKAQQLIKASGVATPVTVQMDVEAGVSIDEQVATIVQGIWSQLGVNVQINTLSPTDYTNAIEEHKAQSYIRLDGPGVIDPGYFLGYDMVCGISFNLTAMCIPKADKLLAQARKTVNAAQRLKLYDEINTLWIADSPKIPVYGYDAVSVLSKNVKTYYYSHEINFTTWST
jgi:peptide/nickel transport system substrate-binding protein